MPLPLVRLETRNSVLSFWGNTLLVMTLCRCATHLNFSRMIGLQQALCVMF